MKYFDSDDHPINFRGSPLGSGGEGTVWRTDRADNVAKIYHTPGRRQIHKLQVMIENPPHDHTLRTLNHISIAWPKSLILDDSGKPVGFLMPAIDRSVELTRVYNSKLRKKTLPEFDWRYLHVAAKNLAWIVKEIHAKGYVLGDIKPQNIRVTNSALVSIVDTDSFQVYDPSNQEVYRCSVFSPEFTPPELIGEVASNITQTIHHDNFRLAVIIYQLLFGVHPFGTGEWRGIGEKPDTDALIKMGCWAYGFDRKVYPTFNTIPLKIVHPKIKKLFLKCFNDGYSTPNRRPTAEDWSVALEYAISDLIECNQSSNHIYTKSCRNCYWCKKWKSLGVDIFNSGSSLSSTVTATPSSLDRGRVWLRSLIRSGLQKFKPFKLKKITINNLALAVLIQSTKYFSLTLVFFLEILLKVSAWILRKHPRLVLILTIVVTGYWNYEAQFDTSSFKQSVLVENFSNNKLSEYWKLTKDAKIKDGGLFQLQPHRQWYGISAWYAHSFTDVDLSADVIKVGGPDDVPFGLAVRAKFKDGVWNGYFLQITGNGYFTMGTRENGEWISKLGGAWQSSDYIKLGNTSNRLRIVVKGNLVIGFVNGHRVGHFRDNSFGDGVIGFESARGTDDAVAVYFDNVVVKDN
jgi:serine/threonine protein kinase